MQRQSISEVVSYLNRFVLRVGQAVDVTEATKVRAVASADGIDVSAGSKNAAVVVIAALAGVGSIAILGESSSGD